MPAQKRKRATTLKAITPEPKMVGNHVKEEWVELPHNMGKVGSNFQIEPEIKVMKDDIVPPSKKPRMTRSMAAKTKNLDNSNLEFKVMKGSSSLLSELQKNVNGPSIQGTGLGLLNKPEPVEQSSNGSVLRGRAEKNKPEVSTSSEKKELDAKAGTHPVAAELKEQASPKKKRSGPKAEKVDTSPDVIAKTDELLGSVGKTLKRKPKKTKDNPYGLTPGYSPFPDWPAPTKEQCQEVTSLLSTVHPRPSQPLQPPTPSTTVAGCGEVPYVLDAMIRTLLSAATSGRNSSSAFQGLLDMFGKQEDGVGKGSVNWNKVREAPVSAVFEAIKSGGLAKVKSAKIKQILDLAFEQNSARRAVKVTDLELARDSGVKQEVLKEKEMEIERLDQDMLSLDYFHELSSEEAMIQLTRFPNIGVKTASCILLFCLRRPSFAVDTHVWRLSKWLGWVPPTATRDETFSHLEVKCPDDLKYPLHQLFIAHGKACGRCRANTGLSSQDYIDANCPIDHLLTRMGKRKGGDVGGGKTGGSSKKKKGKGKSDYDGEDEDEDELSDWNPEAAGDD